MITVNVSNLSVVEINTKAFVVEGLRIVLTGEGELDLDSLRARYLYTEKPGSRFVLESESLFHAKMWAAGYSEEKFTSTRKEVEHCAEVAIGHFLQDRGFLQEDS